MGWAKRRASVSREPKPTFEAVSFLTVCGEQLALEPAVQFSASFNKGSARGKAHFVSGLGTCETLLCRPLIITLVRLPVQALFILKRPSCM